MKNKFCISFLLIVLIALITTPAKAQILLSVNQKIENLKAFTRLYGYVKYFHPSDEADKTDWDKFAVYGTSVVVNCENRDELIRVLNNLFLPVAPSIKIYPTENDVNFDINCITPENKDSCTLTYWQHQGVGYGMVLNDYSPYASIRVNRSSYYNDTRIKLEPELFEASPEFGEYINKDIGSGISAIIPLVLCSDKRHTYPIAKENLHDSIFSLINRNDDNDLYVRLGGIVVTWNVFQHFYPYFDVVDVNWSNELENAFLKCLDSKEDYLVILEELMAPLRDGHISVHKKGFQYGSLPVEVEIVEDKLIITAVYDNTLLIKAGDIIDEIKGMPTNEYLDKLKKRISAANVGSLLKKVARKIKVGDLNSELPVVINGNKINLVYKPFDKDANRPEPDVYKNISKKILYMNFDKIENKDIAKLLPEIEKKKVIICDLRYYPKNTTRFISSLLKENERRNWMFVPWIMYPDRDSLAGYKEFGWGMKPYKPHINAKVIFITSSDAISYAESFMGYIEGYNLATIVGQPTAGTNGNVNKFSIPGNYTVRFTGMKVLKHDGSQHHGIGIIPDVLVEKTIKGVKEGRDEFLEKAIEIAKESINKK